MIEVEGLTKYYGERAAIHNLSFTIQRGEVIGFLGLNGAGKTTTLKVLGCILLPTAGRVQIDGIDVTRDPHEVRKRIGFLPDTPPLYNEMTVGGYLSYVAQLRGVSAEATPARVADVENKTALGDVHEQVIGSLSHGYRQRVGVAQAIVHNPSLLILDEPASGLDPVQIVEMRNMIRGLRGAHTILLSSHILSEVSQTCDRLLVIHEGQIAAQGSTQDLAKKMGGAGLIEVDVAAPGARVAEVAKAVQGVTAVKITHEEGGISTVTVEAPSELRPKLVRALVEANLDVMRVDRAVAQLESIFLKLTQGTPYAGSPYRDN